MGLCHTELEQLQQPIHQPADCYVFKMRTRSGCVWWRLCLMVKCRNKVDTTTVSEGPYTRREKSVLFWDYQYPLSFVKVNLKSTSALNEAGWCLRSLLSTFEHVWADFVSRWLLKYPLIDWRSETTLFDDFLITTSSDNSSNTWFF